MERIIGQGITQDIFSLNKLFKIHINLVFLISENIWVKCSIKNSFFWNPTPVRCPLWSVECRRPQRSCPRLHPGLIPDYQSFGMRTRILAGRGRATSDEDCSEFTILDYRIFWGIIQFIWWKSSTRKKHKKHFVKLKMTSWMGGRWLIWVKVTNTHWYNLRDFIFLSKEKMGDNLNQILQNHQNQLDSSHEMVQDMNHMKHEMHGANVHENHDMMMMMYFYFGYENVQMIIKAWVQNISWK